MQKQLTLTLIILILIYIFFISKAVKKKKMRIGYLIFWIITAIVLIIALLIPNLIEKLTKVMGFELPVNMIFSIAIFIILYLLFDLTTLISSEEQKTTMLIQEVSILKKRVQELEEKQKNK